MVTGLLFILLGLLILWHPEILVAMIAGLLMLVGLGIIATSWQLRRLRRRPQSRFVNWIVRF